MDERAALIAVGLLVEMLAEASVIDRHLTIARLHSLAQAERTRPEVSSDLRRLAELVAHRACARVYPRALRTVPRP